MSASYAVFAIPSAFLFRPIITSSVRSHSSVPPALGLR